MGAVGPVVSLPPVAHFVPGTPFARRNSFFSSFHFIFSRTMMCSQSEYSAPCRQSSQLLEFCCRPSRSPFSNLTSLIGHSSHTSLTLRDFRLLVSHISFKPKRLSTENIYKIWSLYSKLFLL